MIDWLDMATPHPISTAQFVAKAQALHGAAYDYSRVVYVGNKIPIEIRCIRHDRWIKIRPDLHVNVRRQGCRECGRAKAVKSRTKTRENFIADAMEVHGDKYDYSRVVYINALEKVEIGLRDGTWFWQTPANHLTGHGSVSERNASFADKYRWTTEQFIAKAIAVHGDRYDYSRVDYRGATGACNKVWIGCKIASHGWFEQVPQCHIDLRQGCPRCATSVSSGHREMCDFLDTLGVDHYVNDRKILNGMELDIVIPAHRIAIEFCGLYWHGENNQKDKNYHLRKHDDCAKAGWRLITIFEDEWQNKKDIVKSTLGHFCYQTKKGVYARTVTIREIDHETASKFVDAHHLMGRGSPGRYRIGAFSNSEELVGVMIFGHPNNEQGSTGQLEMTRFATDGRNHPGLGSKMFKWAVTKYDLSEVVAFVDRRWFTGSFKTISGFRLDTVIPPGFEYTDCQNRYHRRFMSRAKAVALGAPPNATKREMMRHLGYDRIWDCGRLRYIWHASPIIA